MRIHERILELIAADKKRCLNRQQLVERYFQPGGEQAELLKSVDDLLVSGALVETKTQALQIAQQKGQCLGQILFRSNGSARFVPLIENREHSEAQFMIRKEIYNKVKAAFAENGIDFARREVRVALPTMDNQAELTSEDRAAIAAAATQAAQEQASPQK